MSTMTTKTTVATVAALSALAFGAGAAVSRDQPEPAGAGAQGAAPYGMGQGDGQGRGSGMGHGNGQGRGNGQGQGRGRGQGAATSTTKLTLSSAAKAELLYMREEEKLAADVYATLAKQYPSAPFSQITRSEAMHASAVQRQLDRAGLTDPTKGNAAGEFENADLQELYDALVQRGAASLTEALKVGALIEETDIADLRTSAKTTKDAQLLRVYSNLERASGQHLRIFVGELKSAGTSYTPTVLSKADVNRILAATMR